MIVKCEVNPSPFAVALAKVNPVAVALAKAIGRVEASAEELKEEVATWPSEPYRLDWDTINWN